jgi:hypothetical protein
MGGSRLNERRGFFRPARRRGKTMKMILALSVVVMLSAAVPVAIGQGYT